MPDNFVLYSNIPSYKSSINKHFQHLISMVSFIQKNYQNQRGIIFHTYKSRKRAGRSGISCSKRAMDDTASKRNLALALALRISRQGCQMSMPDVHVI